MNNIILPDLNILPGSPVKKLIIQTLNNEKLKQQNDDDDIVNPMILFFDLSIDLQIYIFKFLDAFSLISISRTSSYFYRLTVTFMAEFEYTCLDLHQKIKNELNDEHIHQVPPGIPLMNLNKLIKSTQNSLITNNGEHH